MDVCHQLNFLSDAFLPGCNLSSFSFTCLSVSTPTVPVFLSPANIPALSWDSLGCYDNPTQGALRAPHLSSSRLRLTGMLWAGVYHHHYYRRYGDITMETCVCVAVGAASPGRCWGGGDYAPPYLYNIISIMYYGFFLPLCLPLPCCRL